MVNGGRDEDAGDEGGKEWHSKGHAWHSDVGQGLVSRGAKVSGGGDDGIGPMVIVWPWESDDPRWETFLTGGVDLSMSERLRGGAGGLCIERLGCGPEGERAWLSEGGRVGQVWPTERRGKLGGVAGY